MSAKELKFKATFDSASFSAFENMIDRLIEKASKLAGIMGQVNGQGGGLSYGKTAPGQPPPLPGRGGSGTQGTGIGADLAREAEVMDRAVTKVVRNYEKIAEAKGKVNRVQDHRPGSILPEIAPPGLMGRLSSALHGMPVPFAGMGTQVMGVAGQLPGIGPGVRAAQQMMANGGGLTALGGGLAAAGIGVAGGMAYNAMYDSYFGGNYENMEAERSGLASSRVNAARGGNVRFTDAANELRRDGMKSRAMQRDMDWEGGLIKSTGRAIWNGDMTEWSDEKRDIARTKVLQSWEDRQASTDQDKDEKVYQQRGIDNARADLSKMHALGMGGTYANGKGGGFRKFLQSSVFGEGEILGMHAGVEGAGSLSAAHSLTYDALSASGGGLRNAGAIYGGMSRGLGVAGARTFGNALMQTDQNVSAMNQMGGFIAQQQMSGTGFTGGLGMLGAMQEGVGKGDDSMYRAHQNIAGVAGANRLFGGTQDAFQKGTNLLTALKVNPGGGMYQNSLLANGFDFKSIAEMAGTGKLTDRARSAGLSVDQIKAYANETQKTQMNRFVDNAGQGSSPMLDTLRKIKASGLSGADYLKGLKGKDREKGISDYGLFLEQSGQASSYDEGVGEIRDLMGLGKTASTKGKRGGAAGKGTKEEEVAAELLKDAQKYADAYRINADAYVDAIKKTIFIEELRQQSLLGIITQEQIKNYGDAAYNLSKNKTATPVSLLNEAKANGEKAKDIQAKAGQATYDSAPNTVIKGKN